MLTLNEKGIGAQNRNPFRREQRELVDFHYHRQHLQLQIESLMSSTTIEPEERTEFAFKFAAQCTASIILDGSRSKNIWGIKSIFDTALASLGCC